MARNPTGASDPGPCSSAPTPPRTPSPSPTWSPGTARQRDGAREPARWARFDPPLPDAARLVEDRAQVQLPASAARSGAVERHGPDPRRHRTRQSTRRQSRPPLDACVIDTGSVALCVPEHVAVQLRLDALEEREVTTADGKHDLVPTSLHGALVLGDGVLLGSIPGRHGPGDQSAPADRHREPREPQRPVRRGETQCQPLNTT